MSVGIREEPRIALVRFQNGFHYEIRDTVELLPYKVLRDLVQMCIRMEQQLKSKTTSKNEYPSMSSSWKDYKKEGYPPKFERTLEKEKYREKENYRNDSSKDFRHRDVQCFKCLERGHFLLSVLRKEIYLQRMRTLKA